MSGRTTAAVTTFKEAWVPEFVKSVEMFTGVSLVSATAPETAGGLMGETETFVWQEQHFTRGRSGRVWVGLPLSQSVLLTGAAAESQAEQIALAREVIDQSVRAAAQRLATGACPGLVCAEKPGADGPPASIESAEVCWFAMASGDRLGCAIRCDSDFEALIGAPVPPPVAAPGPVHDVVDHEPAMFDRFAGVELPVSVVLGRSTLRIRDVLKLAVGSLIELDTRTSDPVDVCVHDGVVARGEVVSIGGNYGIRILQVTSQRDRIDLTVRHRQPASVLDTVQRSARVH